MRHMSIINTNDIFADDDVWRAVVNVYTKADTDLIRGGNDCCQCQRVGSIYGLSQELYNWHTPMTMTYLWKCFEVLVIGDVGMAPTNKDGKIGDE